MIRNLGDLGVYQMTQDTLKLKTPGRKYSTKKDSKTVPPGEFFFHQLDPRDVRVGDIIDVSDYRKTNSYIVTLNAQKKLVLVQLPAGGSGYGIIPLSISSFFKNAIDAFGDKADIHEIQLSPKDKGLKEYFFKGKTVPRAYSYTYMNVTDTVDVKDPVSKKIVTMDRSGKMLAPYLRKMFKTVPTDALKFQVSFTFNPQRQEQINKLWTQVQQGTRTEQQYRKLKDAHHKTWREFRDKKTQQIDNIFIKNYIKTEFGGGGGGAFHTRYKYKAEGTKPALDKAKKALVKLNQTTPDGSLHIQLI